MALLPSFFILQSGSKYLSLTEHVPASVPSGFLKFDEEQIWSPRVKFAAEPAKTGDGRFVHIRSLYNNKYLVRKKSWIVASARKPEEDTSKDSCTLFEPFSLADDDQPTSVRLRQVLSDNDEKKNSVAVTLSASSSDDEGMLQVASSFSSSSGSVFSVIDRASLVVLPSQVAFRHNNDQYMRAYDDGNLWERLDPGFTIEHPLVAKELIPTANGNYRIKDLIWDTLFRCENQNYWIWADSKNQSIKETEFSFVQIEDNVFAFRSLGNYHFCGPLTMDGKVNCLSAMYPTPTKETLMIVEERVLKREILEIEYRVSDPIIYDEQAYAVQTQTLTNSLPDSEFTATLTFTTPRSRTISWRNSQTINFGVTGSTTVTVIPLIVETGIEMHVDTSSTHAWGESETTETTTQVAHAVTVPPGKIYYVTLTATRGTCDIPFNYNQRDLLTTGETVAIRKHDGIYTCRNNYYSYKIQEKDLLLMDDDDHVTTTS